MSLVFTGKITEIREPRIGTSTKGEWASVEFEVTELKPQNSDYPQVALFDMFKNGDYTKYVKDFKAYYPLGTPVSVQFNLKKNEYTNAQGELRSFYKTSAWKVEKIEESNSTPQGSPSEAFEPAGKLNEEKDDLPF